MSMRISMAGTTTRGQPPTLSTIETPTSERLDEYTRGPSMTAPTLLTIVAILLYATLLTPGLIDLGVQLRQLVTVLGMLGAASVAVLGAVVAARRQATRRACWAWLLAAFGLLSVWLGVVCWSSLVIVLGETPENPSWADPWFLLAYPLISAALVLR